jgi:hypothetical protein
MPRQYYSARCAYCSETFMVVEGTVTHRDTKGYLFCSEWHATLARGELPERVNGYSPAR